ncbi:LemA family protein [Mahella australiensis 50-1 BON]|uniref:LemA family protein n=1 Tax=Mahella australiensis (strain DSM 15567 / CIP 107919 / 50-1 BON) TaxID=697281 RepID=F4A1D9_MAHA5|nr:LemA family protein [Mahella australiensis]AEE97058.1 LemA family protein [Mahella australiensis 50-1 BON]
MKRSTITWIVIIAVILILAIVLISSYNNLVNMEENVNSNWSQVDNMLQRRADLIPNLVETVKGYAAHEQAVFDSVNQARESLLAAQTAGEAAQADQALNSALGRLLAIAENYPELKANQNFIALQDELAGTENRIAVSRRDYNNAAQQYNAAIRRFPTNIIAGLFGFEQKEYFQAEEGAQKAPQVDFSE